MRQCSKCERRFAAGERVCPHDGTLLSDTVSFEEQAVGRTLDGKYRIDGFLQRGGMGAVYRGTHLMLNKPVAIKLIKPELVSSTDVVQRFLREARAAAHLSHPNIVTVHDLGQTTDGTLYIVMELVDGSSLKEMIVSEGAWEPKRTVRLLRGIGSALALAHRKSIVRRDLKPQNIMVRFSRCVGPVPKSVPHSRRASEVPEVDPLPLSVPVPVLPRTPSFASASVGVEDDLARPRFSAKGTDRGKGRGRGAAKELSQWYWC